MLGRYFDTGDYHMLYVETLKGDEYHGWETLKHYIDQPGIHLRKVIKKNDLHEMVRLGKLKRIAPPTFFIITKRDSYAVKKEIKAAGGRWSDENKFWFFNEKPNLNYTYKECIVFPFTGKRL